MMRAKLLAIGLIALASAGLTRADGLNLPAAERFTLDNGLRVILLENETIPMVGFELWIDAGAISDPKGQEGLASLTGELLRKGAGDRDATNFAQTLDHLGANFRVSVGLERTRVALDLLAKDFDLGLELLTDAVMRPSFREEEIEKQRSQMAETVSQNKENPRWVLGTYHRVHLFGDHDYGRPTDGTDGDFEPTVPVEIAEPGERPAERVARPERSDEATDALRDLTLGAHGSIGV